MSYLTDSNGAVVTRLSYTPYGEKTKTGPDIFHQKYTGQIDDDDESGLLYYKSRYYDPSQGRFITADSIIPGADKTQAYNRYMYVVGNPISLNDPDGHSWKKWVKRIAGAAVGFAVGGPIGAVAGYAAVKYRDNIKNFISDHGKQILTTGAGYLIGGPIGAIYGYAAGSDGGIKEFWNDHKWFRIMTYVLVTAAVIAACILLSPLVFGVISGYCMLSGALIGASVGFAYGGTNGFTGGWDWENAFKGMAIGAVIGAIIGLAVQYAPPPQNDAEIALGKGEAAKNVSGSIIVYGDLGESTVLSTAPVANTVGYNSIMYHGILISIGLGSIKIKKWFN